MDLLNQAIPPAVLLLGAGNLTRALYGISQGFGNHVARFVPLGSALALTACYIVVLFIGPIFDSLTSLWSAIISVLRNDPI